MSSIRLVTFDALFTLIHLREPIHIQYASAFKFRNRFGDLDPLNIQASFKTALQKVKLSHPSYARGHESWWTEVIRQTALGAGAYPDQVETNLADVVHDLLDRFSSKRGYATYEDVKHTLTELRERYRVKTALATNTDKRTRLVFDSLELTPLFDAIVISEEEGVAKPSSEFFKRVLDKVNASTGSSNPILPQECMHIGDDLKEDYYGARDAGMKAALLCRPDNQTPRVAADDIWTIDSLDQCLRSDFLGPG